jgi:hypothetical protein
MNTFRVLTIAGVVVPELPCAGGPGLVEYADRLRMWRNWQTRYFEVVVP